MPYLGNIRKLINILNFLVADREMYVLLAPTLDGSGPMKKIWLGDREHRLKQRTKIFNFMLGFPNLTRLTVESFQTREWCLLFQFLHLITRSCPSLRSFQLEASVFLRMSMDDAKSVQEIVDIPATTRLHECALSITPESGLGDHDEFLYLGKMLSSATSTTKKFALSNWHFVQRDSIRLPPESRGYWHMPLLEDLTLATYPDENSYYLDGFDDATKREIKILQIMWDPDETITQVSIWFLDLDRHLPRCWMYR